MNTRLVSHQIISNGVWRYVPGDGDADLHGTANIVSLIRTVTKIHYIMQDPERTLAGEGSISGTVDPALAM